MNTSNWRYFLPEEFTHLKVQPEIAILTFYPAGIQASAFGSACQILTWGESVSPTPSWQWDRKSLFFVAAVAKVLVVTFVVYGFKCLYVEIALHWAPQEPSHGMIWPLFLAS